MVIQKEIRFLIRVAVLFDTEDRMWKCVCPWLFCNWEIRSKQAGKYHNKSHGSTPLLKLSQSEHSSCCRVGSEKGETEQTKGKERERVCERDIGGGLLVLKIKTKRYEKQGKGKQFYPAWPGSWETVETWKMKIQPPSLYLQRTLMGMHSTSLQNSG